MYCAMLNCLHVAYCAKHQKITSTSCVLIHFVIKASLVSINLFGESMGEGGWQGCHQQISSCLQMWGWGGERGCEPPNPPNRSNTDLGKSTFIYPRGGREFQKT